MRKREGEAHAIYSRVIGSLTKDLRSAQGKFTGQLEAAAKKMEEQASRKTEGKVNSVLHPQEAIKDTAHAKVEGAMAAKATAIKQMLALVWISYMKSARRCEVILSFT